MLTWEISFLVLLVENTYLLYKGAETGDGFAHNEHVHFASAFIGINGLAIGYEAPLFWLLGLSVPT
jgi:hypothetical protein